MDSLSDTLRSLEHKIKGSIHTMLPARLVSFNAELMTASVEVLISRQTTTDEEVKLPIIDDVIVSTFQTSNFSITLPLSIGDEGMLIFCERSIDNWHETGEVGMPAHRRTHDYSDGFFMPVIANKTRAIKGYSPDSLEIRMSGENPSTISLGKDGNVNITAGGQVSVTASSDITLTAANTLIDSPVTMSQGATVNGGLIVDGKPYAAHTHEGVTSGNSKTGVVSP